MKVSRLILVSRPWGYVIGPMLFFVPILIFGVPITWRVILQAFALSAPLCMLLFGINDFFDRSTDALNPRKGGIHGAALHKDEGKAVIIAAALGGFLLLLSSLLTGIKENFILATALVILSIIYSAPPRLKEIPPLDSVSNAAIIYVIIAMGYSLVEPVLFIPLEGFFRNGYPLLISIIAIHMFSTIMDYIPDRKAGVRTLATSIGKRRTAFFAFIMLAISALLLKTDNVFILSFMGLSGGIYLVALFWDDEKTTKSLFMVQFAGFLLCGIGFLVYSAL